MATTLATKLLEDDSTVSQIVEALTARRHFIDKLVKDITPDVTKSLDSALTHDAKTAIHACDRLTKQHDRLEK